MRLSLGAIALLAVTACNPFPMPTVALPSEAPVGKTAASPPPWPAPKDPIDGLWRAGLRDYVSEHYATHIHIHLSVYVDGTPVPVPAGLGIAPDGSYIAPLHTHLDNGVVHLQAPEGKTYTLGQVFTVWGVPLTGAIAYDKGVRVPDAAGLMLQGDHEIAVTFGKPPATIPTDYGRFVCVGWGICE
jgi:hypothetical protein